MDPLSALSIAAAVVQFVDFGQRLLSETWRIYRGNSGQSLELQDLSAVSNDLARFSAAVRDALGKQQPGVTADGGSVSHEADEMLRRVCGECDALGSEIQQLLPTGRQFGKAKGQPSVGESFRDALKRQKKLGKVQDMNNRLNGINQKIMTAAIMSIWLNFRDTKGWERRFSSNLDEAMKVLDGALVETRGLGPEMKSVQTNDDGFGEIYSLYRHQEASRTWQDRDPMTEHGHNGTQGTVETRARESIKTTLAEQIVERLWSKDWKPDRSLLSSFPQKTFLSARDLKSVITNSLRFQTMDSREQAIMRTFRMTYQWFLDPTPPVSATGEPMWSSFPEWLESNSDAPFWITGKPGAGKSTMMKHIANHPQLHNHLTQWAQGSPLCNISYYAWKPGLDLNKSEDGLIRTLLYQVLLKNPDLTPVLCPRRWTLFHTIREPQPEEFPDWTTWELMESFEYLLGVAANSMRLIIFVDGLDEFDIAPVKLCSLIQRIAQQECIKVCVASRKWQQFSDAFATSPTMEMHLLTHRDIESYVFGSFEGVVAFQQLNELYPNGGQLLLSEMVSKAQGVFLWIALVTQTIRQTLDEGGSLPQLQDILNEMPPEIEGLYDAIYATIPKRLLPDVSVMLRIFDAACTPLDWLTLWIADETRGIKRDIDIRGIEIERVGPFLQRRISARTRGILELVKTTKTVEYHHRAAAEWVTLPRVMDNLRAMSPAGFDPCMCLLWAETIQTANVNENFDFWGRVARALFYASLVDGTVIPDETLVDAVDQFHRVASDSVSGTDNVSSSIRIEWPTYLPGPKGAQRHSYNTFNGLAVQFAILPYVRCKFSDEGGPQGFHPVPAKGSLSLLEQAVFGCDRYCVLESGAGIEPSRIPPSQSLEMVAFLLSKKARHPGLDLSVQEAMRNAQEPDTLQYLQQVYDLLKSNHSTRAAKRDSLKRFFKLKRRS